MMAWIASGCTLMQSCPGCNMLVERSSGCDHMTCRCRQEFCFGCGEPWPKNRDRICCRKGDSATSLPAVAREVRAKGIAQALLGAHEGALPVAMLQRIARAAVREEIGASPAA